MTRILMWPVWWLAVLATIGSGAFWGHRATAGTWAADDLVHVEAAGAYTATALIAFAAAAALEGFDGPRVCRRIALASSAVFLVLAGRAAFLLTHTAFNEDPGAFTDGATEPLMAPWAWLLLVAGACGWARIHRANAASRSNTQTSDGVLVRR